MSQARVIRDFQEEDRSSCATILYELPEWFGIPEATEAYIKVLGTIPTAVILIDGEIVGFAALEQHNPGSVELHVIAVDRSHHNQGIGSELLRWSEAWCPQVGATWFHVKTLGPSTPDASYERTRKFYLARGFEELFESLTHWGPECAALIMVKKLEA